jgi:hypothetical protein
MNKNNFKFSIPSIKRLKQLGLIVIVLLILCVLSSSLFDSLWINWLQVFVWILLVVAGILIFGILGISLFLFFKPNSKNRKIMRRVLFVLIRTFIYSVIIPIFIFLLSVWALEILEISTARFLWMEVVAVWLFSTLCYFIFCLTMDLSERKDIKIGLLFILFGIPIILLLNGRSVEKLGALFPLCYCVLYFITRSIFNKLRKG